MNDTAKDRLLAFITTTGASVREFERKAGLYNGYMTTLKGYPSKTCLEKIVGVYPELNKTWLLTGEGEMLKSGKGSSSALSVDEGAGSENEVLLLPVYAQGGSLNDFVMSVKESDCEKIISPIRGADYAMSVSGDSMAPEYPSGSQILIKKINERAFIDWGRVYVLDTCNGTVIKRLFPAEEPDRVVCKSINPEYPPFEVALEDVYGIYRVLMSMSLK